MKYIGIKEYLKKYSLAKNLKEIARHAFKAGYDAAIIHNYENQFYLNKENIDLKAKIKDLEKCLKSSDFYL